MTMLPAAIGLTCTILHFLTNLTGQDVFILEYFHWSLPIVVPFLFANISVPIAEARTRVFDKKARSSRLPD